MGRPGSGKTSTAKAVARKLGFLHLDSGALYRAVTLYVLNEGVDVRDQKKVAELARKARIKLEEYNGSLQIFLNELDVSDVIREPRVTSAIAPVAANPEVRDILAAKQREIGSHTGIVAEGRDMGTVIFPDAELKIFMLASIDERAKRRYIELKERNVPVELNDLINDINKRDESDKSRDHSPLKEPEDAVILDSTGLTIDEQVEFVVAKALKRGAKQEY